MKLADKICYSANASWLPLLPRLLGTWKSVGKRFNALVTATSRGGIHITHYRKTTRVDENSPGSASYRGFQDVQRGVLQCPLAGSIRPLSSSLHYSDNRNNMPWHSTGFNQFNKNTRAVSYSYQYLLWNIRKRGFDCESAKSKTTSWNGRAACGKATCSLLQVSPYYLLFSPSVTHKVCRGRNHDWRGFVSSILITWTICPRGWSAINP